MRRRDFIGILVTLGILIMALGGVAVAQSGGSFELPRYSIDSGGGTSSSGSFTVKGLSGQLETGTISGGTFTIKGGIWQENSESVLFLPLLLQSVPTR